MPIGDKTYTVEINDSEFEREGWKRGRYKGTKLTSTKLNKFTPGDITYGKEPVISQYTKTVYVFNQANNSFGADAGVFYPSTDEFNQTLPDKQIIGAVNFKIDRAVTFTIGNPRDFSQIEPGTDKQDPSFHYFDTLIKTDLSLFNSCSVRFFDNVNNGFVKPKYIVGYNSGEFNPAAAYFQDEEATSTGVHAITGESQFDYELSNDGRLYINPNVEDWFISQTGASGSQGTLNEGNTAITINHVGDSTSINSMEGYFFGLSSRLGNKKDSYYISFDEGNQGTGTFNQKNIIKAFDIHELEDSGSNINLSNNEFSIKTTGRYGSTFTGNYESTTGERKEEFILFREKTTNNNVHLNFNLNTEAPAGVGNGGIIVPDNLHPAIKESLNVYLGNAGLGAQGGATAQFGLGGAVQSVNARSSQQASSRRLASGRIGFQGSDSEELSSGISKQISNISKQTSQAFNLASLGSIASTKALDQAILAQTLGEQSKQEAQQASLDAAAATQLADSVIDFTENTLEEFELSLGSTVSTQIASEIASKDFATSEDVSNLVSEIGDYTTAYEGFSQQLDIYGDTGVGISPEIPGGD